MRALDGVVVDVCGLTVSTSAHSLHKLRRLFRQCGIEYGAPPLGHPLESRTIRLRSMDDMNMVLLLLYGEVVDCEGLCRLRATVPSQPRPPPSPATVQAFVLAQRERSAPTVPAPPRTRCASSPTRPEEGERASSVADVSALRAYFDTMNRTQADLNRRLRQQLG